MEVEEEVDFPVEEEVPQGNQGEDMDILPEETMIEEGTSWWETLQKYSEEYEQKLSLSLLFGGSTQALTVKTLPSPTRTKRVSYSSQIGRAHV